MLEIYAPFILNSGITQETEVPSVEDFQQRVISNSGRKTSGLFVKLIMRSPVMLMRENIVTAKDINGARSHQFIFQKNILVSELQMHCTLHCLIF